MAINNIPNLFQSTVPGTASMPITYDSTPSLLNIDQAQIQQAINQKKIDEEQQQRKRLDQQRKLQNLADTFAIIGANRSGQYGQANNISDRMAQRKALFEQKQKEALLKTQQDEFVKNNPQYKNAIQLNTLFPGVNLPTTKNTETERLTTRLVELNNKPTLSDQERTELNVLKTKLYGQQKVVPFLDSDGNPINQVITNWDLNDKPDLITQLNKQGFVTVGSGPSSGFKAPTNASDAISNKWESFTNEINLINDLGKLIVEGEDSITFAGKVADVLNSGIYQFKSAGRLLNFQQNDPQGYAEQINDIQNEHKDVLDKISADRGIGASLVMQLAYGLAKNVDPNARLTDRDIEAAVVMLGGEGGNAKKRLATFNKLVENRTREYNVFLDKQKLMYGNNKKVLTTIKNFETLPKFGYYSSSENTQSAESILEELERDGLL